MPTYKPKQQAMIKPSPVTSYAYTMAGNLILIEAVTAAGVAGAWYVTAAEALSFAIKQAKETEK